MTTPTGLPTGPCSVCGRLTRLLTDGTVGLHSGTERDFANFRARCQGYGKPPKAEESAR